MGDGGKQNIKPSYNTMAPPSFTN